MSTAATPGSRYYNRNLRMPRNRPQSLDIRTPIDGPGYGTQIGRFSRVSPIRNTPIRMRYCRNCVSGCHPVPQTAGYMPVPYMMPMMYASTPPSMAHFAPMTPMHPVPHSCYSAVPLPQPPYPVYETTESSDSDTMDEARNEFMSTLERSTVKGSLGRLTGANSYSNLVRDFEETNWIPLGANQSNDVQDWTIKRSNWFQRSVELPNGSISKLKCIMMSRDAQQKSAVQRLSVEGTVRKWSISEKALVEETFSEILILPQGTDLSTISYKLLTKNLQQYSEERFTSTLRHNSTYDLDNGLDDNIENTVVVTGKVVRMPIPEVQPQMRQWSKDYKHTVQGTVDLSHDGQVVHPVLKTYSDMPETLANLAPTPDQDTFYSIIDDGCEIKLRLDEKVDANSIKLDVDTKGEIVKVVFTRHSDGSECASTKTSDGSDDGSQHPTTTAYDMQVNQTFKLSSNKFDTSRITKRLQGRDLYLFIPFNAARTKAGQATM